MGHRHGSGKGGAVPKLILPRVVVDASLYRIDMPGQKCPDQKSQKKDQAGFAIVSGSAGEDAACRYCQYAITAKTGSPTGIVVPAGP